MSRRLIATLFLVLAAASFAEARPYNLQWDRNVDGVTAGYTVSYGTASGSYGSTAGIDAGNVTSFQVDLLPGTTYYFRVTAYSADNSLGQASTELSFVVPVDTTITASSTSVLSGSTLTGTVGNGPANRLDWVGFYAVGSTTMLDWKYLSGSAVPPASGLASAAVTFTAPATPGLYHLRFFSNNSYTLLATSATVTVTSGNSSGTASVTFSATTVSPGAPVIATVANGLGNRLDWVGLYAVGSSTLLDWKYLNGTAVPPASGLAGAALTFTAPMTPGAYRVHFFSNNSYAVLATSATLTVSASGSGPSVTPSTTTIAPGAALTVTVANGPGNRLDWVALYAAGSNTFLDWKYLSGTAMAPASGLTGAVVTFIAPTAAGPYQLRFFSNNSYTLLASSATVTVP